MIVTRYLNKSAYLAMAIASVSFLVQSAHASGGATDPIPGTSKSGLNSGGSGGGGGGGGGGGKTPAPTPTPTPTPAPAPQPVVTGTLTFTASGSYNGSVPQCTGTYRVDPYYPTLSLLTVSVQASSVSVADGTYLYVYVNGTGGTLYPFTSNAFIVTAGSGSGSTSLYVTPGTTITSVMITDVSGNILSVGN